jgi:ribose-phosphate pyrophosphokinase
MLTFKSKDKSGEIINSALHEFTFPAGEKHIKQTEGREIQDVEIAIWQPTPESIHDDLFTLGMWMNYIIQTDVDVRLKANSQFNGTKTVLIMPYVPGARADRGIPFGLGTYAQYINNLLVDQIIIFDPHSQKTPEILKGYENLTVLYPEDLFAERHMAAVINGYTGIIAPDKGAVFRAEGVAKAAGLPVYTATKERDEATGKLSNFKIEGLPKDGNYLIVDDICDGGGTFLGLADAAGLDYGQLDLYVSHGVFSKDALKNLKFKYEYIFTTNSFAPKRELNADDDKEYNAYRRFDVIRLMESKIKF